MGQADVVVVPWKYDVAGTQRHASVPFLADSTHPTGEVNYADIKQIALNLQKLTIIQND
jgi:hypothetical protein